jgi:hypothetical protein
MSLTSFLDDNADVREYLRTAFRKPENPRAATLVAPPLTKNPQMLGTAFDYLARWMIRSGNLEAIEREHWVADEAVRKLPDKKLQKRGREIVQKARATSKQFLKTGDLSDGVIAAAVSLAQLDTVFRTGRYVELVGTLPQAEDLADLRSLALALPLDRFKATDRCFLNPTFGDASLAIGGADADIIIDDLLLDIKVRKDAALRTEDFHQVLVYYLLYEIGGIDGLFYLPHISRVGFYSARYRLLTAWPVKELMTGVVSLDEVLQWLRRRLEIKEIAPEKNKPKVRKRSAKS